MLHYEGESEMLKLKFAALVGAAVIAVQPASAATLVDTGQPINSGGGSAVVDSQWLAAEFTLETTATINGVQGWIGAVGLSVPLRVAIYSDGGDVPGSKLYSADFIPMYTYGDWQGASGLSWALADGDYWVSFESDTSSAFAFMPEGAPRPLHQHAFSRDQAWLKFPSSLGVRVFGTTNAVPEPAAWALMISGFGLVGAATRRRMRAGVRYA
jgi:hypothetical protein